MVKQDSGFRFWLRKAFKFQTSRGVCQDPESGFFASRTLGSKATDRGFGSATREILLSVSGFLKKIGTKFYRRKTCPWGDLLLLTRTVLWRSPPSTSLYSASSFFSETHYSFIPRRNLSERDWCRYIPCQLSTAPSWHHLKNKNKTVLQVRTVYPGFRVWIFHPGSKLKKTPDTESCLDLDQKIVTKLSVLFSIPTWIRNNENKIKDEDKWGGGERERWRARAQEKKNRKHKEHKWGQPFAWLGCKDLACYTFETPVRCTGTHSLIWTKQLCEERNPDPACLSRISLKNEREFNYFFLITKNVPQISELTAGMLVFIPEPQFFLILDTASISQNKNKKK